MQRSRNGIKSNEGGIQIHGKTARAIGNARQLFLAQLKELGLERFVKVIEDRTRNRGFVCFQLKNADSWAPEGDTAQLCQKFGLDPQHNDQDLQREILLAMLLCPVPFQFPSYNELASAVRIRRNIVQAARKTSLAFATYEAERPAEYWTYGEDCGFILNSGRSLIDALRHATQPESSGQRYTFSCRRAAEYVVLLAIASEVADCHFELFQDLQMQAETRALKGREFEGIFHRHIGCQRNPLPVKFFIPGDRTWFRNPEEKSSEITGYEGSWTFYLGSGDFADFWRPGQNYNLATKCLTIFHWRNSTYRDANGDLQIDERRVESLVASTLNNPTETSAILRDMIRLQEPLDVFAGGCIEAHRESTRHVCRGTADLNLPDVSRTNRAAAAVTTAVD